MKSQSNLSHFDLAALLNRAAAAIETPKDLTAAELRHVVEDLNAQADALDPMTPQSTTPRASGNEAHTPTAEKPWFVGSPIRSADTAGICVTHFDGEEIEETIAEVLPSTDGNKTRDKQAAFILRACNEFDSLITLARNVSNEQNSPYREQALAILSRVEDSRMH